MLIKMEALESDPELSAEEEEGKCFCRLGFL